MANDFKAAAERKKKMNEGRKAQRLITQMEEVLNDQDKELSAEDAAGLQAQVEKLKELAADASASTGAMMAANEEAQMLLDAIAEKLAGTQAEAPASGEPAAEAAEEPPVETPAEEVVEAPVVPDEEVPQGPSAPERGAPAERQPEHEGAWGSDKPVFTENEGFDAEGISEILLRMYKAPRYSRLKGETKVRFSALIKPSLVAKMREDQAAGRITSPNDLINGLLEIFYGEN